PTTLLAQVDSSVGGKTGVDHKKGKNLIGAFHQPKAVICDMAALKSLSDREFRCGLAEVIKYGVIRSVSLFRFMEESVEKVLERENGTVLRIVGESCRIKARVVEEDEREGGIRAILNYGHTFAHGIETALNYKKLKHGEAVAIGMVMAANLSYSAGCSSAADAARIEKLVMAYGLPTRLPKGLDSQRVIDGMGHDKKVLSGKRRLIVYGKIGRALICENPPVRKISKAIRS
ncbi:MAG: 3-dehydroquinate synthase family protein, partial [Nitrospinota bacterium]